MDIDSITIEFNLGNDYVGLCMCCSDVYDIYSMKWDHQIILDDRGHDYECEDGMLMVIYDIIW